MQHCCIPVYVYLPYFTIFYLCFFYSSMSLSLTTSLMFLRQSFYIFANTLKQGVKICLDLILLTTWLTVVLQFSAQKLTFGNTSLQILYTPFLRQEFGGDERKADRGHQRGRRGGSKGLRAWDKVLGPPRGTQQEGKDTTREPILSFALHLQRAPILCQSSKEPSEREVDIFLALARTVASSPPLSFYLYIHCIL